MDEVDTASGKSGGWTRPTGGSSSKTGGVWNRVPSSGNGGSSYVPPTGTRPSTYVRPGTTAQPQQQKATIRRNAPPKMSTGVAANSKPRRTLAENNPPETHVIGPGGLVVDTSILPKEDDEFDEDLKAKPPVDVTGGDVGNDPSGSEPTAVPSGKDETAEDPTKLTGIDPPTIPLPPTTDAAPAADPPVPTPTPAPATEPAEPLGQEAAEQLGQEAAEPLGQEATVQLGQEAADPSTADSVVIPPTGGSANAGGDAASKPSPWTRPAKVGGGSTGTKPPSSNASGSAPASAGNAGQGPPGTSSLNPSILPKEEFVDENKRADRPQYGVGGLVIVPSKSNGKPNPRADGGDIEPEDTPARPPLSSGDPLTEAKANERIKKQFRQELVLEGQWQDEHGADFVKRHGSRPLDAEGAANWDKAREREIQSWGRQRKLEELRRQRKQ